MSLEEPKLHDGLCKTFEKQIKDCQKLIKGNNILKLDMNILNNKNIYNNDSS